MTYQRTEDRRQRTEECQALLQRVSWRCRRGLLELDIVLKRFVEENYVDLSAAEKQTFEELLDMPDNQLWDMISCRTEAAQGGQLLEKIRAV